MKFKTDSAKEQLGQSCAKLQEVVAYFEQLSLKEGIEPLCTRMWDAVCGDSGVHEAKRAADFRNETRLGTDSAFLYSKESTKSIVDAMNQRYPRKDGKVTCMHHSFQGAPFHFHLQIMVSDIV